MPTTPSPLLTAWPDAVAGEGGRAGVAVHLGDPAGEQRAATGAAALVDAGHRDVVTLHGPDRLRWLHDLTTQHLADLPPGGATRTLLLSPSGHVEVDAEVADDGTTTWLDVDAGAGAGLVAFLERMRFLLRVEVGRGGRHVLHLLGPEADRVATGAGLPVPGPVPPPASLLGAAPRQVTGDAGAPALVRRRADDGLDLLVEPAAVVATAERLQSAGARPAGLVAADAVAVAARRPRLAVDADERALPAELGLLGEAVHLEKGCYRGQETVARVHNLGRPPRRLVLVHLDGSEVDLPDPGTPLEPAGGGRPVGRLGGPVRHAELGPVALALVKRSADVSGPLRAAGLAAAVDPDDVAVPLDTRAARPALARLGR